MADTLDQFLRTSKRLYEEIKNELKAGKQGLDKFLFPISDSSTSANFSLDKYTITPYAIIFKHPDEQAHVRPYQPGSGTIYDVPRSAEKTPISESLRDAVVAGIESTADFNQHHVKMLADIIRDHTVGHEITRWKRALDVIRTGIFYATGIDGESIGLDINFSRNAAQDITYDFTTTGNTIDKALKELNDRGDAYSMGKGNRIVILGTDWYETLQEDDDVLEKMKANSANVLIEQAMSPSEINNVQGLYYLGRYKPNGCINSLELVAYSPDSQFVAYKGATAADFMPSDEALLISADSPRYSIDRGVDALDGGGNIQRVVGRMVFDSYTEKDPPTEFLRSQARFCFVPADVNKTVRSTGTFSES